MRTRFFIIILICASFLAGCSVFGGTATPPPISEADARATKKAAEPTATITPTPLPRVIVDILGNSMLNVDPMDRALETKFEMMDAWYGSDGSGAVIFKLTVNCDGLCSRERTFAVTIQTLRNDLGALEGMIPTNITELQIITLKNFQPSGAILVNWKDALDYCNGVINDAQLAARIVRQ